jgi:hypothetical protein
MRPFEVQRRAAESDCLTRIRSIGQQHRIARGTQEPESGPRHIEHGLRGMLENIRKELE